MAFDYELATQGIVKAITQAAEIERRKSEVRAGFAMDAIKSQRQSMAQKKMAEFRNPKLAIFRRIEEKDESLRSPSEKKFYRKFLGIDDEKKKGLTTSNILQIRRLAKEKLINEFRRSGGDMKDFVPTEEAIEGYMEEAKAYLFPELDEAELAELVLPKHIKKTSEAVEYLKKEGMDEVEAKSWLRRLLEKVGIK